VELLRRHHDEAIRSIARNITTGCAATALRESNLVDLHATDTQETLVKSGLIADSSSKRFAFDISSRTVSGPVDMYQDLIHTQFVPLDGHINHTVPIDGHINHTVPIDGHINHTVPIDGHLNQSVPQDGHIDHTVPIDGHLNQTVPLDGHINYTVPIDGHLNQTVPLDGHVCQSTKGLPDARTHRGHGSDVYTDDTYLSDVLLEADYRPAANKNVTFIRSDSTAAIISRVDRDNRLQFEEDALVADSPDDYEIHSRVNFVLQNRDESDVALNCPGSDEPRHSLSDLVTLVSIPDHIIINRTVFNKHTSSTRDLRDIAEFAPDSCKLAPDSCKLAPDSCKLTPDSCKLAPASYKLAPDSCNGCMQSRQVYGWAVQPVSASDPTWEGQPTNSNNTPNQGQAAPGIRRSRRLSLRLRYEQREFRATLRMAVIMAFFCGMWIGFFTVYVLRGSCTSCFISRELDAFFFWLGYANSSVNPVLYAIFNDDFRRAFIKVLGGSGTLRGTIRRPQPTYDGGQSSAVAETARSRTFWWNAIS